MKHAGQDALDRLEPLLRRLRGLDGLKEKKRGSFYRNGRNFLHFHEDPAGFFADVRLTENFERVNATKAAQRTDLRRRVRAYLAAGQSKRSAK